jgi:hypothetical protein
MILLAGVYFSYGLFEIQLPRSQFSEFGGEKPDALYNNGYKFDISACQHPKMFEATYVIPYNRSPAYIRHRSLPGKVI